MSSFTVICWINDPPVFEAFARASFRDGYQLGAHTVKYRLVGQQHEGRPIRNMGHAYNLARRPATDDIRIYMHQDVCVLDRTFLNKLECLFALPYVGAVGVVGSTIDTGASHFMAPAEFRAGTTGELRGFQPQAQQVKILDGMLFATNLDFPWCDGYQGAHMVIEDACMKVRGAGKEVWIVDSLVQHRSAGTIDDGYWRSVKTFRNRWDHALPPAVPTVDAYKQVFAWADSPDEWKHRGGWTAAWTNKTQPGAN